MGKRVSTSRFAMCVNNDGYEASLDARKVYRIVPDASAQTRGLIRIVDESGDDYLYPAERFIPVQLPQAGAKAFTQITKG